MDLRYSAVLHDCVHVGTIYGFCRGKKFGDNGGGRRSPWGLEVKCTFACRFARRITDARWSGV